MYKIHRRGAVTPEVAAQWREWRYGDVYTVQEIADREGVSKGTVSRHTKRPQWTPEKVAAFNAFDVSQLRRWSHPNDEPTKDEATRVNARAVLDRIETSKRHLGGPDDDHYAALAVQPIEATEAWSQTWPVGIAYHLGEAVAAIARCGTKGQTRRDLEKARWLLDRALSKLP